MQQMWKDFAPWRVNELKGLSSGQNEMPVLWDNGAYEESMLEARGIQSRGNEWNVKK